MSPESFSWRSPSDIYIYSLFLAFPGGAHARCFPKFVYSSLCHAYTHIYINACVGVGHSYASGKSPVEARREHHTRRRGPYIHRRRGRETAARGDEFLALPCARILRASLPLSFCPHHDGGVGCAGAERVCTYRYIRMYIYGFPGELARMRARAVTRGNEKSMPARGSLPGEVGSGTRQENEREEERMLL